MDPLIDNKLSEPTEKSLPSKFHLFGLIGYVLLFMCFAFYSSGDTVYYNLEDKSLLLTLKLTQLITVFLVFALPAFLFVRFFTHKKTAFLKLNFKLNPTTLVISAILFIVATPAIAGIALLNEAISFPTFLSEVEIWMKAAEENAAILTESFLKMDTISDLLLNILVIAFAAAFTEELFFRGALQSSLLSVTKNKHLSVWVAAILFSAMHGQFYGFIPRAIMGGLIGYLFLWSGSLWLSIFVHFVNNGFAVTMSWFVQRGIISKDIETIGDSKGDLTIIVVSALLTAGLIVLVKKTISQKANLPNVSSHQ